MTVRITKPEINFREKISELDFDKVPYDKMPYGSIIQVTAGETEYRTATSSSTYQPTDMYATITPRFASSKIYITLGGDGFGIGELCTFFGSLVAPRLKTFFGALFGGPLLRCPLKIL